MYNKNEKFGSSSPLELTMWLLIHNWTVVSLVQLVHAFHVTSQYRSS